MPVYRVTRHTTYMLRVPLSRLIDAGEGGPARLFSPGRPGRAGGLVSARRRYRTRAVLNPRGP